MTAYLPKRVMTHELDGTVKRGHVVISNAVMEGAGWLMAEWKEEEGDI